MCLKSSGATGRGVGGQLWCSVVNSNSFGVWLRSNVDTQFDAFFPAFLYGKIVMSCGVKSEEDRSRWA